MSPATEINSNEALPQSSAVIIAAASPSAVLSFFFFSRIRLLGGDGGEKKLGHDFFLWTLIMRAPPDTLKKQAYLFHDVDLVGASVHFMQKHNLLSD